MLSMALFLELVVALFSNLWLEILRLRVGGCLLVAGVGISGIEGAGWITVVMLEARQQHLQRR